MQVAIRDDDTSYLTSPDDLDVAFGDVWDIAPVSLAIVPFVGESYMTITGEAARLGKPMTKREVLQLVRDLESQSIIPLHRESGRGAEGLHPLHENAALVDKLDALLRSGRISAMLHGYSHAFYPGGYEFEVGPDLRDKTRAGREYLQATLRTSIDVFVPPNNSLSCSGTQAVVGCGITGILTAYSHLPWERPLDMRNLTNFARMLGFWAIHRKRMRYPRPLDFGTHKEMPCYPLHDNVTFDEVIAAFEGSKRHGQAFCVSSHIHTLVDQPRIRDVLTSFVHTIAREYPADVQFVRASELFSSEPSEGPLSHD